MTTTLATQRNFVISTPSKNAHTNQTETATPILSHNEIKHEIITSDTVSPPASISENDPLDLNDVDGDDQSNTTEGVQIGDVITAQVLFHLMHKFYLKFPILNLEQWRNFNNKCCCSDGWIRI